MVSKKAFKFGGAMAPMGTADYPAGLASSAANRLMVP